MTRVINKRSVFGGFFIVAVDALLIVMILSQFPFPLSLLFVLPLAIVAAFAMVRLMKSLN